MTEDWYPPKTEDIRKVYARAENNGDESYLSGWYAEKGFDAWLKEEKAKIWDEAKEALVWELDSPIGVQSGLIRPTAENPYRGLG